MYGNPGDGVDRVKERQQHRQAAYISAGNGRQGGRRSTYGGSTTNSSPPPGGRVTNFGVHFGHAHVAHCSRPKLEHCARARVVRGIHKVCTHQRGEGVNKKHIRTIRGSSNFVGSSFNASQLPTAFAKRVDGMRQSVKIGHTQGGSA